MRQYVPNTYNGRPFLLIYARTNKTPDQMLHTKWMMRALSYKIHMAFNSATPAKYQ